MGRLLAESFTRHDPPAVAVGLTAEEFEAFVSLWSSAAAADGLTIVARDVATHRLAGALLTDDAAAPPPEGLDGVSKKFDPILDLLGHLDTEYRTDRAIEPGRYLHLFLLGVAEQFTRRKIGQHLVAVPRQRGRSWVHHRGHRSDQPRVSAHLRAARVPDARCRVLPRLSTRRLAHVRIDLGTRRADDDGSNHRRRPPVTSQPAAYADPEAARCYPPSPATVTSPVRVWSMVLAEVSRSAESSPPPSRSAKSAVPAANIQGPSNSSS